MDSKGDTASQHLSSVLLSRGSHLLVSCVLLQQRSENMQARLTLGLGDHSLAIYLRVVLFTCPVNTVLFNWSPSTRHFLFVMSLTMLHEYIYELPFYTRVSPFKGKNPESRNAQCVH